MKTNDTWNIREVVNWSVNFLKDQSIPSPRVDVEQLLAHVLKCGRVQLYMHFDKPLTINEREQFKNLLRRRVKKEPVAYIIGEKEFFGRPFTVNSSVLIPRPDTESLIEHCLEIFPDRSRPLKILDIGSGSGAIGLTLACEYPEASVHLVDVCAEAIACGQRNAQGLEVESRVQFIQADARHDLMEKLSCRDFDLIISNPPYIPDADVSSLMDDVLHFEPALALKGGVDGLIFYRDISKYSVPLLKCGSYLVFEVGVGQSEEVSALMKLQGFQDISARTDLGGVRRVVSGRQIDKGDESCSH